MSEPREMPSVEFSLKSVSWHLKTIAEELKKCNDFLSVIVKKPAQKNTNGDFPF